MQNSTFFFFAVVSNVVITLSASSLCLLSEPTFVPAAQTFIFLVGQTLPVLEDNNMSNWRLEGERLTAP